MKALSERQWLDICSYANDPVELKPDIDGADYYVYDREFGYFVVGSGAHQIVMAHLWAFRNGYETFYEATRFLYDTEDGYSTSDLADRWLQMPGTCFFSSMGYRPTVWKKSNLNFAEKRILGPDFAEVD